MRSAGAERDGPGGSGGAFLAGTLVPVLGWMGAFRILKAVLMGIPVLGASPEAASGAASCVLLPVSLAAWFLLRPPADSGGERRRRWFLPAARCALCAAAMMLASTPLPSPPDAPDGAALVRFLGTGVAGPVNEEIVYRGFVLRRGSQAMGFCGAAVFSSLLFAAGHGTAVQGLTAFLAGMGFALAAEDSGTLLASALLHIVWNLLSLHGAGVPGLLSALALYPLWMLPERRVP